ncbi:MAG TPA: YaiO family outer membrane beta-barrel protein [Ottowia sp.]|uniref:YaiO family outer membrane beta-barrel protein n=1 Tax=Ottowia sp. TaxID=1898956 RepID=UPI002C81B614|nr:YaiO family outer membrane beta-barrel protein [Ottowia sp.]HMN22163.1 YaiO family outer membrane beta-barrel protein [Ottowia sp.]
MTLPTRTPEIKACPRIRAAVLLAALCLPIGAAAQVPVADPPRAEAQAAPAAPHAFTRGQVEVGLAGADLSGGNRNWTDVYARGHYRLGDPTMLYWSAANERHFGASGVTGGLTLVHDFSPAWYGLAGVSGGSAIFQNKRRFDLGLYHKWPQSRRWVTGVGLMSAASGDGVHRDFGLRASVIHYAEQGWVGEGGLLFNRSSPGSVWATRGYGAMTWGAPKQHYLSVRLEHGREAYLPVGLVPAYPGNVSFRSTELTLQWRQWLHPSWGYVVGLQGYRNPYYRRFGISAGLFMDF